MLQGSCLCGKIKFEISIPGICINHCHCSRCRKAGGGAFGTFLHTKPHSFQWVEGEALIKNFQPREGGPRPFCQECGTRVPVVDKNADHVIVPAGLLEGDPGSYPVVNIYVGSKASWYQLSDSLPKFTEDAPDDFWLAQLREFEKH